MALVARVLKLAAAVLAALLIAGFFQRLHPAFDALAHFRLHLCIVLGAVSVVLLPLRAWRTAAIALVICAAAVKMMKGAWLPSPNLSDADLTVLQFNARFDNPAPEAFLSQVARVRPDAITLQEVSSNTAVILAKLKGDYPFQLLCPFASVGGVAVVSRHPVVGQWCAEGDGFAAMRIDLRGRLVTVASVHLHWPWPYGQLQQIDRLLPVMSGLPRPVVIAGDFNAAVWSESVRRIAVASRTSPIQGIRLTFAKGPSALGPLGRLPIDHVLVPADAVGTAWLGQDAGSDHRPVIAKVKFRP